MTAKTAIASDPQEPTNGAKDKKNSPSASRRSKGDGGLFWNEKRKRWIAEVTVGYTPTGRRIYKRGSGITKTAAQKKLKEILKDHEDGLPVVTGNTTVADAVNDWLKHGQKGRAASTTATRRILADQHIIPHLGMRKLRELTTLEGDEWLEDRAKVLSTRTLRDCRWILDRSIDRAMARDLVKRNVIKLCEVPVGQPGRPSKSLSFVQAGALLDAAEGTAMEVYVDLSLLTGARTEELRELSWEYVDLDGDPEAKPPIPPHIMVWRSVRAGGDTKTKKSRRSLALPLRCVLSLKREKACQLQAAKSAGVEWSDKGLVIPSEAGTARDAANVRRSLRVIAKSAGLNEKEWSPRELRHTFVSLLADSGMTSEEISKLVGHSGTEVTETVYRHQLRPVIRSGALAMDALFPAEPTGEASSVDSNPRPLRTTEPAETADSEHSEIHPDQDR